MNTKSKNSERILVFGGTGFIGQHFVETLKEQKRKVFIFRGNLQKKEPTKALKNIDIVVNLVGFFNNTDCYPFNLLTSFNFLQAAKDSKVKKIIFISSGAVYGRYKQKPYLETDALHPVTNYGLSKYLSEEMYQWYSELYSIPTIVLRLSNTYGPGNKIGIISETMNSIANNKPLTLFGNGMEKRDFVYVKDVAKAIVKSIDYPLKDFSVFNISGSKVFSTMDIISKIEKVTGKKIKLHFAKTSQIATNNIKYLCLNHKKAFSLLSWKPETSLERGIEIMKK